MFSFIVDMGLNTTISLLDNSFHPTESIYEEEQVPEVIVQSNKKFDVRIVSHFRSSTCISRSKNLTKNCRLRNLASDRTIFS